MDSVVEQMDGVVEQMDGVVEQTILKAPGEACELAELTKEAAMINSQLTVVHSPNLKNKTYEDNLSSAGYQPHFIQYIAGHWRTLSSRTNGVLLLDTINFSISDVRSILEEFLEHHSDRPALFLNTRGLSAGEVACINDWSTRRRNNGTTDHKSLKKMEINLKEILAEKQLRHSPDQQGNIIGRSPQMNEIFTIVQRVGPGDANILVTGESGVGKELVTRSIHQHSLRRNQPFIAINCGALPPSLFESELFGYEKGAFTGATKSKMGLIELANGGTLFLDEICEMAPDLQVKLLRVLEERTLRRVGGRKEIAVDIRLLSATNQDINTALYSKSLREDLFFRISTIRLQIPPLRERAGDVELLANHFLQELERKNGRGFTGISSSALAILERQKWPGNVRELRNVVEHAYYMGMPPVIEPECLDIRQGITAANSAENSLYTKAFKEAKEIIVCEFEKTYLLKQLERHDWHISNAADASGIDRRTIHRLIRKYELTRSLPA